MPISLKSTVAAPVAAYGSLKSSIALMDFNPGTRSWTVPAGVKRIRLFVVGGGGYDQGCGGGYSEKTLDVTAGQVISYTVGAPGISTAPTGGTSSAGGVISATGGAMKGGAPGVGSGGDVNTSGGNGLAFSSYGGASAGHAFGNGSYSPANIGAGFSSSRFSYVDGWKIGLLPGESYGYGGIFDSGTELKYPGMGGGGSVSAALWSTGGLGGGGGGTSGSGGPGLVGIEVIA
jgi:hypothetical protein